MGELARGAPPRERAVEHGREAGRIIAPMFEPSQSVEQPLGDIVLADDPDNSAHAISPPSWLSSVRGISPPSRVSPVARRAPPPAPPPRPRASPPIRPRRSRPHRTQPAPPARDRKSVVSGKSGSVRVDSGGCRILKKTKQKHQINKASTT